MPNYINYTSFSKKHTQVFTNNCVIEQAFWEKNNTSLVFTIQANRFLRGMVRGLVATMLKVGTSKLSIIDFEAIIASQDAGKTDFSAPSQGLFLNQVLYEKTVWE